LFDERDTTTERRSHVFRTRHAAWIATAVAAMALGGAGVALAAGGGGSSGSSSGAGTTAPTTTQSSSHHCDHDNSST
jgi:hypothetical protein